MLITRASKGSALTHDEMDDNLEYLEALGNPVTGWGQYSDTTYTSGSPFGISSGSSFTALPNNKGAVNETYLPTGVTTFYDGTKITPENIGDYYIFTVRFKATNTSQTGSFDFGIDIGGSLGIIFQETLVFSKGSGVEHHFSIDTPGFILGTFKANGGIVKIDPIVGNLSIYDIEYQIVRMHKGV